MAEHRVLSADAHILEPPDLWTSRMDPKYGDLIPHLVHKESFDHFHSGEQHWGLLAAMGGANAGMRRNPGTAQEEVREGRFSVVRPGAYDPHARIKDAEGDGIYGEVIYPGIGLGLSLISDQKLARAIMNAYTDWLSEFCKPYPDRLKGIPLILLDDVNAGVEDLRRAAELGLAGALICTFPGDGEYYDNPKYEPFWAAAEELEMPLTIHGGSFSIGNIRSQVLNMQDRDVGRSAVRATLPHWVHLTFCHIILSGVLDRHPNLKFVSVENGIDWVPYFLGRIDGVYTQSTFVPYRFKGDTIPSDYMRQNVFYSFMDDDLGIALRHMIGVDQLVWGSDYPHPEGTYPNSQEILDRMLADVPENERAKITGGNCARLYNFK